MSGRPTLLDNGTARTTVLAVGEGGGHNVSLDYHFSSFLPLSTDFNAVSKGNLNQNNNSDASLIWITAERS